MTTLLMVAFLVTTSAAPTVANDGKPAQRLKHARQTLVELREHQALLAEEERGCISKIATATAELQATQQDLSNIGRQWTELHEQLQNCSRRLDRKDESRLTAIATEERRFTEAREARDVERLRRKLNPSYSQNAEGWLLAEKSVKMRAQVHARIDEAIRVERITFERRMVALEQVRSATLSRLEAQKWSLARIPERVARVQSDTANLREQIHRASAKVTELQVLNVLTDLEPPQADVPFAPTEMAVCGAEEAAADVEQSFVHSERTADVSGRATTVVLWRWLMAIAAAVLIVVSARVGLS